MTGYERGPLALEATALPTEPQPLPKVHFFFLFFLSMLLLNWKGNYWPHHFLFYRQILSIFLFDRQMRMIVES